ncbi:MAG: guanine-1-methyltransferase-domain-containing protein [Piptocephalis tieghemiana]|nr:MAG: guanine-1-methyltransferase-domain-containing protein [Piptocephalis tieghemiana]
MSKNAQKRARREAARLAGREEWKAKMKEKRREQKARRKEAIAAGLIAPPTPTRFRPMKQAWSRVRAIIDLDFPDDLMNPKEISSLCRQIARCHSANTWSSHPIPLEVTSFRPERPISARLKDMYKGCDRWITTSLNPEPYKDTQDLIYLTADSPNTLETLEAGKTYILGGLVDKNRYKNICFDKAQKQGIQHARLPIDDYLQMSQRKVLTVNHVFEIMLKYLETKDWSGAFEAIIPSRKFETISRKRRRQERREGSHDDESEESEEEDEFVAEEGEDK